MSTTFYSPDNEVSSGVFLRAGCIYYVTTGNAAVTVYGTVYLDSKGKASTEPYSYYAFAEVGNNRTTTVTVKTFPARSSWGNVNKATFSFSIPRTHSSRTGVLIIGTERTSSSSGPSSSQNVSVPALASYAIKYNANGGSGAPSQQTKWYGESLTLSSTKPTRTNYVFKTWNTKSDGTGTNYSPGAKYTANAAATLYAIWYPPYKVTYNANGGASAPAAQTKVYNTNLTLSSTKPTRTNYVFKTWNTKADGTGTSYSPGTTYSTNANLTLYAIWYAPYTVTYNANGGSGAPVKQTKVYNTNLTLSSTEPTRTNYVFKTWNTKSNGTGTNYSPVATYSTNANLTLYAIWYAPPSISSLTAVRSDSTGAPDDEGSYALVTCVWTLSAGTGTPSGTVSTNTASTDITGWTTTSSDGVSTSTALVPDVDPQFRYVIKVTVASDTGASASKSVVLSGSSFMLDFKAGGGAVGIGAPAPQSGLLIGFPTEIDGRLYVDNQVEVSNLIDFHDSGRTDGKDYMARISQSGGALTLSATNGGYASSSIPSYSQMVLLHSGYLRRRHYDPDTGEWDGWHYIEYEPVSAALSLGSNCLAYGSSYTPHVIRWGCVCQLVGAVKPSKEVEAGGSLTIGTISAAYRPLQTVYVLCQGSGQGSWLLTVADTGNVTASRYRNGAGTLIAISTSTWLPFSTTWLMPSA